MGIRIKDIRKEVHMTQVKFSSKLGISQQTLSRLENNPSNMTVNILMAMATQLNYSTDYILGLDDQKRHFAQEKHIADIYEKYYDLLVEYDSLDEHSKKLIYDLIHLENLNMGEKK